MERSDAAEDETAQEIVRALERWNQSFDYAKMDAFLADAMTSGTVMPTHVLLNVLALTRFAMAAELPSRAAFEEYAEKLIAAEVGAEEAERLLTARRHQEEET